jgi:hypothetical protein
MIKTWGLALGAGLLTLLAACTEDPTQPAAVRPAAASAQPASASNNAADDDVTCTADDVTGSLIQKRIDCSTQRQRDQSVQDARSASAAHH